MYMTYIDDIMILAYMDDIMIMLITLQSCDLKEKMCIWHALMT